MDEEDAVMGGLSSLSGLICEVINSVGQGNFTIVLKKSGNFRNLWLWQPCQNKKKSFVFLKIKL